MESEGKAVLSNKCQGRGNSSEIDRNENVQHEKKSDVRYFYFILGMLFVIAVISEC
jgi:hypothetical protein